MYNSNVHHTLLFYIKICEKNGSSIAQIIPKTVNLNKNLSIYLDQGQHLYVKRD